MKKILSAVVCLILCFALGACSAQNPDLEKLDREETYPDTPAALETIYTTMDALQNDAGYIAEISVQRSEMVPLDGFPRTHSEAEIITVLKGDLKAGDIIEVIEEGGITAQGMAVAGVPPMEAGKHYFLYMTRQKDEYFILGAFQGKFIEKEGYVFQQSTEEVKIKDYSPIKVSEFIEQYSVNDQSAARTI